MFNNNKLNFYLKIYSSLSSSDISNTTGKYITFIFI